MRLMNMKKLIVLGLFAVAGINASAPAATGAAATPAATTTTTIAAPKIKSTLTPTAPDTSWGNWVSTKAQAAKTATVSLFKNKKTHVALVGLAALGIAYQEQDEIAEWIEENPKLAAVLIFALGGGAVKATN